MPARPLTVKVHETDNVAIVVNSGGLPAGTVFDDGLALREHVPQRHKVALSDLARDAPILRYGKVIGRALLREMAWYDGYLSRGKTDRAANTTPGNKKGGLANIVEKAMGSIAKSGSSAIVGVLPPGERVKRKGLIYAATPASDFICGTQQLASGMTLQVFITGRGTPYGLEAAPVT